MFVRKVTVAFFPAMNTTFFSALKHKNGSKKIRKEDKNFIFKEFADLGFLSSNGYHDIYRQNLLRDVLII